MDTKRYATPAAIALVALSALVVVGVLTFAAPCGAHDDGTVSTCFWAGRAILGVGAAATALSIVRLAVRDAGIDQGLSISVACLGALVAAIPGSLIDLCMMESMRCHTLMRPAMLVLGVALCVAAVADVVLLRRAASSQPAAR